MTEIDIRPYNFKVDNGTTLLYATGKEDVILHLDWMLDLLEEEETITIQRVIKK